MTTGTPRPPTRLGGWTTTPTPPAFQPTKWALLDKQEDQVTFVDVDAGQFLRMSIMILRRYLFVDATSGGLILLGEKEEPHQTRLLNPFMGAIAHFKVRAPTEGDDGGHGDDETAYGLRLPREWRHHMGRPE
jgi:hypothetical protein